MNTLPDFIRINSKYFGTFTTPINMTGLSWPPPEFIVIDNSKFRKANKQDKRELIFHRISMSKLSDEKVKELTGITRGAEYKYLVDL